MLDINYIRLNADLVKKAIADKNLTLNIDELLKLDTERRLFLTSLQNLQTRKNEIAKIVKTAPEIEKTKRIEEGRQLNGEIADFNGTLKDLEKRFLELMLQVPNIPSAAAPLGLSDAQNVVVKTVGEKPKFHFQPKGHKELLTLNNWVEINRTVKIAGERTYILKGEMVLIEMAIHRMVLHKLKEKGFDVLTVPAFAREQAFVGTGHFPSGKDQVYKLEDQELFLAGTGEVVVNNLHKDEILKFEDLPIKYAAHGPCFRSEAGSAGKDAGGILRVHQFNKTEQYILCENNVETSECLHRFMLEIAEEIMSDLEIPYQIVEACTGDMGVGKYRMNDIEAWVPSENKYRETHSCSNLTDWQARRTNLRYKDKDGTIKFCHTLNCTGIATPRVLVPLLENHQKEDGTIALPEKLKKYL